MRSVLNEWQSLYSSQQINEMSDPIEVSHRYTLIPFAIPEAYRRRVSIISISPPRPGHTVGTQPVVRDRAPQTLTLLSLLARHRIKDGLPSTGLPEPGLQRIVFVMS